jgi:hypothetical protein
MFDVPGLNLYSDAVAAPAGCGHQRRTGPDKGVKYGVACKGKHAHKAFCKLLGVGRGMS